MQTKTNESTLGINVFAALVFFRWRRWCAASGSERSIGFLLHEASLCCSTEDRLKNQSMAQRSPGTTLTFPDGLHGSLHLQISQPSNLWKPYGHVFVLPPHFTGPHTFFSWCLLEVAPDVGLPPTRTIVVRLQPWESQRNKYREWQQHPPRAPAHLD